MDIRVFSRKEFQDALPLLRPSRNPGLFVISICAKEDERILEDSENVITLFFDDIGRPVEGLQHFTHEMGEKLYDFIQTNLNRGAVAIHCHAGISRSGAVGAFIADISGIPYDLYKRQNPQIFPNPLVELVLRQVHHERTRTPMPENDMGEVTIELMQTALTIARGLCVCENKTEPDTTLYSVYGGFEAYKALLRFQELDQIVQEEKANAANPIQPT